MVRGSFEAIKKRHKERRALVISSFEPIKKKVIKRGFGERSICMKLDTKGFTLVLEI